MLAEPVLMGVGVHRRPLNAPWQSLFKAHVCVHVPFTHQPLLHWVFVLHAPPSAVVPVPVLFKHTIVTSSKALFANTVPHGAQRWLEGQSLCVRQWLVHVPEHVPELQSLLLLHAFCVPEHVPAHTPLSHDSPELHVAPLAKKEKVSLPEHICTPNMPVSDHASQHTSPAAQSRLALHVRAHSALSA
jgi:hypothetical protein